MKKYHMGRRKIRGRRRMSYWDDVKKDGENRKLHELKRLARNREAWKEAAKKILELPP